MINAYHLPSPFFCRSSASFCFSFLCSAFISCSLRLAFSVTAWKDSFDINLIRISWEIKINNNLQISWMISVYISLPLARSILTQANFLRNRCSISSLSFQTLSCDILLYLRLQLRQKIRNLGRVRCFMHDETLDLSSS